jgi:hypothetical protein
MFTVACVSRSMDFAVALRAFSFMNAPRPCTASYCEMTMLSKSM